MAGINKINVNRDILPDYYSHLVTNVGKIQFTQLLEEGTRGCLDINGAAAAYGYCHV
jgi:hypothetical protein